MPDDAAAVDFSPMNADEARDYINTKLIENGVRSDGEALDLIIETAGTSSAVLDSETEKIILYTSQNGGKIFDKSDAAEICGFSRQTNPFDLSNAIRARNPVKAAETVLLMLKNGEQPLAMLGQISLSIEMLLKAKRASASGGTPAGMSPGQYRYLLRNINSYTEDKLLRSLEKCLEADAALKSSSGVDPSALIRGLILEITRGR